jgi:hypothetical protein
LDTGQYVQLLVTLKMHASPRKWEEEHVALSSEVDNVRLEFCGTSDLRHNLGKCIIIILTVSLYTPLSLDFVPSTFKSRTPIFSLAIT